MPELDDIRTDENKNTYGGWDINSPEVFRIMKIVPWDNTQEEPVAAAALIGSLTRCKSGSDNSAPITRDLGGQNEGNITENEADGNGSFASGIAEQHLESPEVEPQTTTAVPDEGNDAAGVFAMTQWMTQCMLGLLVALSALTAGYKYDFEFFHCVIFVVSRSSDL